MKLGLDLNAHVYSDVGKAHIVRLCHSNNGVSPHAKKNQFTIIVVPKATKVKSFHLLLYIIIFITKLLMWDNKFGFSFNNTHHQHQI